MHLLISYTVQKAGSELIEEVLCATINSNYIRVAITVDLLIGA